VLADIEAELDRIQADEEAALQASIAGVEAHIAGGRIAAPGTGAGRRGAQASRPRVAATHSRCAARPAATAGCRSEHGTTTRASSREAWCTLPAPKR
jgi:hypothetical protein